MAEGNISRLKAFADFLTGRRIGVGGSVGTSTHAVPSDISRLIQKCPTVSTCIQAIARAISGLPIKAGTKSAQKVLDKPNEWQTKSDYLYSTAYSLVGWGNSFSYKHRSGITGGIVALAPWNPAEVQATQKNPMGRIVYRPHQSAKEYMAWDVIHLRDGGYWEPIAPSRVALAAIAIQQLISASNLHKDAFLRGPAVGLVVEAPAGTSQDAINLILKHVKESFTGEAARQRGGIMVLAGGKVTTVKPVTPGDTDTRALVQDLIRQVAAQFGCPPFIAGGEGDTKYNNVTARLVAFYRDAVAPIIQVMEQGFSRAFNTPVEIDAARLLTGDLASQIKVAVEAAGRPVLTGNEVRTRILGLDPVKQPDMDKIAEAKPGVEMRMEGSRVGENEGDTGEQDPSDPGLADAA